MSAIQPKSATRILTINGGSSSIKFAVFAPANPPHLHLTGNIQRLGSPQASLTISDDAGNQIEQRDIGSANHEQAADLLANWLSNRPDATPIAVAHRIVQGGIHLLDHQPITDQLLRILDQARSLDPTHLPREITLIQVLRRHFPNVPQIACFDSAFFKKLPRIAKLLPIPRRYDEQGIQRLGFHGISYTYLLSQLQKIAPRQATGRVVFAHLGSGASMAAVHNGQPIDTTMAFTPTAGLVMGTRTGDIDPGLLIYLMQRENKTAAEMLDWISTQCGLLGVSQISSDMRDLVAQREKDPRAAEAVDLFCHSARKFIGAFAAEMGGLDCLVFSGGIGEHSPPVRAQICQNLEFLEINIAATANDRNATIISTDQSRVLTLVVPTDEELVLAQIAQRFLTKEPP
jgi:acetate kinase